jgi:uncharacterized protein YjbI with pentapeptide repeats
MFAGGSVKLKKYYVAHYADLSGADLRGADLTDAGLCDACMWGTRLTAEQLTWMLSSNQITATQATLLNLE